MSHNATSGDNSSSLPSLPTIRLPHKFEEDGTAIWDSFQPECEHGARALREQKPWQVFWDRGHSYVDAILAKPMPECAYCRVQHLVLERLGIKNGVMEIDGYHLGFAGRDSAAGPLLDMDPGSWWRLFSPNDNGVNLSFNPYRVPRCHWTDVNAFSNDSVQFAKNCITDCLRSHGRCCSDIDDAFLPTRMVCVDAFDTGFDVRLDDTFPDASDTRYIALSYCWGDYRPLCMTTASNLEDQMERIRWADLPATFQDAVRFARNLGVRYMWIDSMCIIQNEPGQINQLAKDDWMKESVKMFDVYRNSYATVAALSGRDSRAGLRTVSNRSQAIPIANLQFYQVLDGTTEGATSTTFPLYIQPSHPLDDKVSGDAILESHRERYPLLQRAWCFQERMVSPRVLFFTESEIIYQCLQDARCECGATSRHRYRPERNRKWDPAELQGARADGAPALDEIVTVDQGWRDVVATSYSPLNLSFGNDRLPALGAMGQKFQLLRPNEQYMAGLWSGSLWLDLLWYCRRNLGGLEKKLVLNRPYSLPTWSWASLAGQTCYRDTQSYFDTAVIEIVEARCTYLQSPGFGALKTSVLRVRSGTMLCRLEREDERKAYLWYLQDGSWLKYVPKVGGDLMFLEDCDDTGYQTFHRGEVLCLLEVARGQRGNHRGNQRGFLILRCQDQENNIYTRAGVVWHQGDPEAHASLKVDDEAGYLDILFEREKVVKELEIR